MKDFSEKAKELHSKIGVFNFQFTLDLFENYLSEAYLEGRREQREKDAKIAYENNLSGDWSKLSEEILSTPIEDKE